MAEITPQLKASRDTVKHIAKRFLRHENAVLFTVLLGIMAVLGVATGGLTLSRANLFNVWLQSSCRGIAAVGQAFVLLTAGIDVSIGGIALLCAILGSLLLTESPLNILGAPLVTGGGIAIMLAVGLAVGVINGFFVSRLAMPALIVTLAMWQITKGGAFLACRGRTIYHLPEGLAFFGQGHIAGIPTPIIIFISVLVVTYFVLHHTTFGRSIYAVGGNPVSAWLSGISVRNIRFVVYVISGFFAGLASIIALGRTMAASMVTGAGLELDSIAAVCIGGVSLAGGKGTILGVLIGVLIIGVINNGMNVLALDPAFQDIVKGWIIITAVAIDMRRRR